MFDLFDDGIVDVLFEVVCIVGMLLVGLVYGISEIEVLVKCMGLLLIVKFCVVYELEGGSVVVLVVVVV